MTLDIRVPLGLLFTAIGGLLLFYGLVFEGRAAELGGIPINAGWGAVLIVFGLSMLLLARRRARRVRRGAP